MIQPRYSKVLSVSTHTSVRPNLPTGKNFSGSSLGVIQSDKLLLSILTDSISTPTASAAIPHSGGDANEPQSPLVIEAGKILVVAIWFWCLIGANFCWDSLSTIARYCIQDI